ncbi:hypothetical protein [Humibacillus xanthopallidus]|uniref:hypothetical protein n=1 Tax=Humibacillus xanthopallidus TaxID=412689 RepID=UPI00384C08BE
MSHRRLVLTALAVAAVSAASPVLTGCTLSPAVDGPAAAATAAPAGATATSGTAPGATGTEQSSLRRVEALTALVESRLRAIEQGDRDAWLAPLAPEVSQTERAAQGRVFDRMRAMDVTDLRVVSVDLDPGATTGPTPSAATTSTTATTPITPTAAAIQGPEAEDGAWRARVTGTYRLDGFDRAPRTFTVDLTLSVDPTGPADPDAAVPLIRAWAPADRPQPWDLEGLRVRRTTAALLLVVGSDADVSDLARRVTTSAGRVASVWGRAEPAVWVAPGTDADAARLLGRGAAAMTGVAAVTDGPLRTGEPAGADRIVVVPQPWAGLSGAGRDVVLTHELTHATVRASTTRPVPNWLSEGFAEFVAYRSVPLAERDVVAPALDLVRGSGLPADLPADADFDPATQRLETAYGLSLLAARTLAERHGTPALVRLYRDAAGALPMPTSLLGDVEAITGRSLEQIGTDRASLVRQWRGRITALLGP